MARNTFEGIAGRLYALTHLYVPYHNDHQQSVARAIEDHCERMDYRKAVLDGKDPEIAVIELGCGTGITTDKIFDMLHSYLKARITAVDIEEGMIGKAQEAFKDIEPAIINFIQMDALAYLKSQKTLSQDIVATSFMVHNNPEHYRRELINEVYRVLKESGMFVNADKIAHDDTEEHACQFNLRMKRLGIFDAFSIQAQDQLDQTCRLLGIPPCTGLELQQLKKELLDHHQYDNQPGIVLREKEMEKLLRDSGFKFFEKTYRQGMEATYVARK